MGWALARCDKIIAKYYHLGQLTQSTQSPYDAYPRIISIDIYFLSEVLEKFLVGAIEADISLSELLLKQNNWKLSFFPAVTAERISCQNPTCPCAKLHSARRIR